MTADDSTILIVEQLPESQSSIVIEDNGRVAYAYLREGDEIVSDVWLYNRCKSPEEPEWKDHRKAPFANPVQFALENDLCPITRKDDVCISWNVDHGLSVVVNIHGIKWASLRSGTKPGWCRLARKAGPLAAPLQD